MDSEDGQRGAWDRLYLSRGRPWRGTSDVSWTGVLPGMSVLDAGCGNGKTAKALIDAGARVTAVDFSAAAVDSCAERMGGRASFVVADVRGLPFADGTFDAVLAFHVLEHIPAEDVPGAASELVRVLRTGGRACVRSFAEGDLRSRGKEDVRDGILYRYLSEDEVRALFPTAREVFVRTASERTRFGGERVRVEAAFQKI